MSDSAQQQVKPISFPKTFVWAGVLIIVDAFWVNQGVISAFVGLWMLFVALPHAAFTKAPVLMRRRLARVAIILGAITIVFGLNWANNKIAKSRAEILIAAIKSFKQNHQRYPEKLDELVPEFIEYIPVAKYTFASDQFYYSATLGYHSLFYIGMPPFGRPIYKFEQEAWGYID